MAIESLQKLVDEFNRLPTTIKAEPTLLELSGYPHLENVFSNILQFYLAPNEPHRLGTMVLRCLLSAADKTKHESELQDVEVVREVSTPSHKRIDLVVRTNRFILGIENKIYHTLNNPLQDYINYLNGEKAGGMQEAVGIVLSLNPVKDGLDADGFFKNVTYQGLHKVLLREIGSHALDGNQRYINYLFDFVKTLENLSRGSSMDDQVIDFFAQNRNSIKDMLDAIKNMRKDMRNKIEELGKRIDKEFGISERENISQWYWRESLDVNDDLGHDIPVGPELTLIIDSFLTPTGWEIIVWSRTSGIDVAKQWLDKHSINTRQSSNFSDRLAYGRSDLPYKVSLDSVFEDLKDLIGRILAAVEKETKESQPVTGRTPSADSP